MGEVYRARDTKLDRDVAIKVLPSDLAGNLERRARFIREAKALAGLKHPGIVTIYSVEEAGETLFLTMELVEGRNLDNLVPEDGFPLARLMEIAIPLADAVSYAHRQGITHRDLKPANIMIDEEGRTKVMDFGLAKLIASSSTPEDATLAGADSITAEGKVLGTVAYMSPEQAEGKPVDARSDIFSLGIVLYEMATGRRPFRGDTGISTITAILRDNPSPVHEINHTLPRHLGRIVARCLAKDPERRYQSAQDVRNELEGLKEETTSVTGMEQPVSAVAAKPATSRKPVFLGIAGLVVLAVVLGIWRPWSSGPKNNESTPTASETGAKDGRTMVVILPFENLGPPEDAYFAAGISQEITSTLAAVEGLGLISRTSASIYAGTEKTIREIGQELGVSHVVEGSVRWQKRPDGPDRVRIDSQLIRVEDGTVVWAAQYDREMDDIFEIQTAIAGEVADQLGTKLLAQSPGSGERLTENTEAYQSYLKAKDAVRNDGGEAEFLEAIKNLERAVALDPGFVKAWSYLSQSHSAMYHFYYDRSEARVVKARETADRVFEIAPEDPQGYVALGYYYYWCHKDYANALDAFSRTGNLQENDANVVTALAYIKRRQGEWREALRLIGEAFRLSPKDALLANDKAMTLHLLREFREARTWIDRAIAMSPESDGYYMAKATIHLRATGDGEAAEAIARESPTPSTPGRAVDISFYRAFTGDYPGALALLEADTTAVYDSQEFYFPRALAMARITWLMNDRERTRNLATEARDQLAEKLQENSRDPRLRLALGYTHALLGNPTEAGREGRLGTDLYPRSRDALLGSDYLISLSEIYAIAGEQEEALDLLEELVSIPCNLSVPMIRANPWYRSLQGNPRYEALIAGSS